MNTRNARFWIWWNGGFVKLTLRPDECREIISGGRTEEGWSRTIESFCYCDGIVTSIVYDDGSDCDGRHSSTTEWHCPLAELRSRETLHGGPLMPAWKRGAAEQFDQFAESMNY